MVAASDHQSAERRAGELLREMEKNKGSRAQIVKRNGSGGRTAIPPDKTTR